MPFYAIIGIIWALMVIGIGRWGRQRSLDVTLLKAIQAILTIVALAIVAPDLGIFKTILAILWLFLFLAVVAVVCFCCFN